MALSYIASSKTYNISGSEYTTVSDKKHRLNYIASGQTHELGLTTDSTASEYSPLKIKISDSTYYIGKSTSTINSTIQTIQTTTLSYYTYSYQPKIEYYSYVLTTKQGKYSDGSINESNSSSRYYSDWSVPVHINDRTYYSFSEADGYYARFTGYITNTATYYLNQTSSDYDYRTISTTKTISTSSSTSSHNFV